MSSSPWELLEGQQRGKLLWKGIEEEESFWHKGCMCILLGCFFFFSPESLCPSLDSFRSWRVSLFLMISFCLLKNIYWFCIFSLFSKIKWTSPRPVYPLLSSFLNSRRRGHTCPPTQLWAREPCEGGGVWAAPSPLGVKFHWSSCTFLRIKLYFDFFLHYGRGVEFSGWA